MDNLYNGSTERPSTPDSRCPICLDDMTDNCITNACSHLFCFDCLQSWSNVCLQQCSSSEPTCPLCKRTFRYIYHSFNDLGILETYAVPILDGLPLPSPELQPGLQPSNELFPRIILPNNVRVSQVTMNTLPSVVVTNEVDYNLAELHHWPTQIYPRPTIQRQLDGQAIRTEVYVANVWALPLFDPAGHFRHYIPDFYREDLTELHRLRTFIIRDLVAIRESVRSDGLAMPFHNIRDNFRANVIIREIRRCGIQHLRVLDSVRPFLSIHAEHFFHELDNFAYSPYEISDYDRYVQHMDYLSPANALTDQIYQMYQEQSRPINFVVETIVRDTDDERFQRPNIVEVNSSADGSINRSTDTHTWATIDQPSTSTGIRDSDRSQSVHGGLSRVPYSSQVKRGSSSLDSSSDDE